MRPDPWRLEDGREFPRHPRRQGRLGAVFRAPGLCRLCRRSGRPRPLADHRTGLRQGRHGRRARRHPALCQRGEVQSLAAGEAAYAMAGRKGSRQPDRDGADRDASRRDIRFPRAAGAQSRRAGGAHRQDRSLDHYGAFTGRRLPLAGGRCASPAGEGNPRHRAERPAGACGQVHRSAQLVPMRQARSGLWPLRRAR